MNEADADRRPAHEPVSDVSKLRSRMLRVAPYVVAALGSLLFASSFGFDYGVDNQVAYLLGALRMAHPGILQQDWYATQTTHYHPAFAYLTGALLVLDKSGWSIAIALMVVITAAMTFVYAAAEVLVGKRLALPSFLLLLCIAFVSRTHSVAVSYIVDHILQPSTLGGLGLIAAIPFYLRGNWLASGVALALGGLFHANYLILGFPLFGLAHLMLGRRQLVRRGLFQLGPSLVPLALLMPVIVKSAGSTHAAEAQHIYYVVRSAHHYRPVGYEINFNPFVAWQMIGIALGWPLLRGPHLPSRRLGTLLTAMLAVLWIGTVLTTATYQPRVAQLFVWRLAPFSDLFCQLLGCIAIARFVTEPSSVRRVPRASWALLLAGLGFLTMYYGIRKHETLLHLLAALVFAPVVVLLLARLLELVRKKLPVARIEALWRRAGVWALALSAAGLLVDVAKPQLETVRQRSVLIQGLPATHRELFRWMRKHTPVDARFLTPPGYETMRYHGRRSIVVDWKSTPILPSELVEWRNRLADVCGRPINGAGDLGGYDSMNQQRLEHLTRKYALDYVVLRRGLERGLMGERVFENAEFVVLKLK